MTRRILSLFLAFAVITLAVTVTIAVAKKDGTVNLSDSVSSINEYNITSTDNAVNTPPAISDKANEHNPDTSDKTDERKPDNYNKTDDKQSVAAQNEKQAGTAPGAISSVENEGQSPDVEQKIGIETSFTLKIVCGTLVGNDNLPEEKRALVPEDGIIFESVINTDGNKNAFVYMKEILTENSIHFDFSGGDSSAYIKGINNLYEKDCGGLSGWMYFINGESASKGISSCIPQDGDVIEIAYTCDMGRDLQ